MKIDGRGKDLSQLETATIHHVTKISQQKRIRFEEDGRLFLAPNLFIVRFYHNWLLEVFLQRVLMSVDFIPKRQILNKKDSLKCRDCRVSRLHRIYHLMTLLGKYSSISSW